MLEKVRIFPGDAVQRVSRKEPQGLDNDTLRAIFKADAAALPSYSGVENSQGVFTLIRVSRVIQPTMPDQATRKAFAKQMQQVVTQEELSSYLAGVRARYDVSLRECELGAYFRSGFHQVKRNRVESCVHMGNFSGNAAREVAAQKRGRIAYFHDGDIST